MIGEQLETNYQVYELPTATGLPMAAVLQQLANAALVTCIEILEAENTKYKTQVKTEVLSNRIH